MRADFGALLQHGDTDFASSRGGELLQPYRGGKAGRPCANDDDIVLHRFAFSEVFVGHFDSLQHSFITFIKADAMSAQAAQRRFGDSPESVHNRAMDEHRTRPASMPRARCSPFWRAAGVDMDDAEAVFTARPAVAL